jgi:threonine/homoserine/homoserine lactone efflux protein
LDSGERLERLEFAGTELLGIIYFIWFGFQKKKREKENNLKNETFGRPKQSKKNKSFCNCGFYILIFYLSSRNPCALP